jgi:hypothetical protein
VVCPSLVELEQTCGNSIQMRTRRLVGIPRLLAYIGENEPTLLGNFPKVVTVPAEPEARVHGINYRAN